MYNVSTALLLAYTSTTSQYYHFFVMSAYKIYSFSNFQVYNTILSDVITVLYIRAPKLTRLIIGSLYPLTNTSVCD